MTVLKLTLFFVCLSLSSGAFSADAVKVTPPQQKILGSQNGRYVFGQISDFRSDQYMLDTQTGRLWRIVVVKSEDGSTDKGFPALEPVPYTDLQGKYDLVPQK